MKQLNEYVAGDKSPVSPRAVSGCKRTSARYHFRHSRSISTKASRRSVAPPVCSGRSCALSRPETDLGVRKLIRFAIENSPKMVLARESLPILSDHAILPSLPQIVLLQLFKDIYMRPRGGERPYSRVYADMAIQSPQVAVCLRVSKNAAPARGYAYTCSRDTLPRYSLLCVCMYVESFESHRRPPIWCPTISSARRDI